MNLRKIILARINRPKFRYIISNDVSKIETSDYSLKRKILRDLNFTDESDEEVSKQLQMLVSMCKKITLSPVEKVTQENQENKAASEEKIFLKSLKRFDLEMEFSSYDWKIIEDVIDKDKVIKSLNRKFSDARFIDGEGQKLFFKIEKKQAQNILESIVPKSSIGVKDKPLKKEPEKIVKEKNKNIEKIKNILEKKKSPQDKSNLYIKKDIPNLLKILDIPKDLKDFLPFMDQITLSDYQLTIYVKDDNFKAAVDLLKKKQGYNNKFPKNLKTKLKNFTLEIKEKTIIIKFDLTAKEVLSITNLNKSKKVSKIIDSVLTKIHGIH